MNLIYWKFLMGQNLLKECDFFSTTIAYTNSSTNLNYEEAKLELKCDDKHEASPIEIEIGTQNWNLTYIQTWTQSRTQTWTQNPHIHTRIHSH